MFSGLFGAPKAIKTILLVDVGSGSVGAAIARLNSAGKPVLLSSVRATFPLRLTRSGEQLTQDVLAAASAAFDELRKKNPQHVEHVAFFLAAPWSTTALKEVHFSRTKAFRMSGALLERMLAEEIKSAKEPESGTLIERTAVALRLNGYPVNQMGSSPVTSVDVTLATTHATEAIVDALTDLAHHLPSGPSVTFHSFALPAAYTLISAYPGLQDALIVDAGAEVTELLRLRNGMPDARATAPAGTHMLTRTLSSHAQMGKKEADSALRLAAKDGTRLASELKVPLTDAAKKWVKSVTLALKPLALSGIPTRLFLFGDERAAPWLAEALAEVLLPSLHSAATPEVTLVESAQLLSLADCEEQNPDPFFLCELIYADSRFDAGKSLSLMSTQESPFGSPARATIKRT